MFRVTRYPMISKTESGRVGYWKKYRVAGRVWVPAGHCMRVKSMRELLPSKCSSSGSSALIKMTNKWSNITWSHCIAYKPFLTLCFTYNDKKELLRSLKYLKYLRYIQKGRSPMKYLKFYQGDHHWSAFFLTSSSFLPCPLKSWLTPAMPAALTIALKKT